MREIGCVFIMLKLVLPGQRVVISLILSLHAVLIITDIIACSNPASPSFLCLSFRIHEWTHAVVEERVRLDEVDNVESVIFASFGVGDTKVEPLGVSSCVIIWLED